MKLANGTGGIVGTDEAVQTLFLLCFVMFRCGSLLVSFYSNIFLARHFVSSDSQTRLVTEALLLICLSA